MMRAVLVFAAFSLASCGVVSRVHDVQGDGGTVYTGDPDVDHDGDGYTPNQGDCNDNDATIYPGAPDICDGKDNDCNGIVDDTCDDDNDGYAIVAGNGHLGGDCNDNDPLINPGAVDIPGSSIDYNCDGTPGSVQACPTGLSSSDPKSLTAAFELCDPWLVSATINSQANAKSHGVKSHYGVITPKQGGSFAILSTGIAADTSDAAYDQSNGVQPGTDFGYTASNPLQQNGLNVCGSSMDDPSEVNDYLELKLTVKVPTNASSFSFNFRFMTSEYPEYVGSEFNDKFLVILDSKSFKGNISFDAKNNPITVNSGFFDVCDASQQICADYGTAKAGNCATSISDLAGTGYELQSSDDSGTVGGGTGWLTTTSPVTPGETAVLRFIIFDEGDGIYDSAVIIDNFQWQVDTTTAPITIG